MNKLFNKAVLNGTTVMGDGLTYPRIPNVYTGDNEGGYQRGDMMDANAVVEMIKKLTDTGKITIEELQNLINEEIQERVEGDQDQQRYTDQKIKDLIGISPETLDTFKEIADALGEDPDFAANVWNKIAELTTKHNEDVQELQDAITSGFENIDFTPYVKKTDVVTNTTNGLMLASDKVKLDSFEEAEQYAKAPNLPDSVISNVDIKDEGTELFIRSTKNNIIDGSRDEITVKIPVATSYHLGLMPANDKSKLANPINYYYRNAEVDTKLTNLSTNVCYTGSPVLEILGNKVEFKGAKLCTSNRTPYIDCSTSKAIASLLDGLMSKEDKAKLDSQPTIKASDATGVTNDDYVVIKKSEYQSILDRLSALENNA